METQASSILVGLISGLISALVTYFSTRSKIRLDLAAEYEKELRQERLVAYKKLWLTFKPLARYSPETPVNYQVIKSTSEAMRDWYFDGDGIYLTKESREPYFKLKEFMQKIIDDKKLASAKDEEIDRNLLAPILQHGSLLRTSLTDDIGARKRSFI